MMSNGPVPLRNEMASSNALYPAPGFGMWMERGKGHYTLPFVPRANAAGNGNGRGSDASAGGGGGALGTQSFSSGGLLGAAVMPAMSGSAGMSAAGGGPGRMFATSPASSAGPAAHPQPSAGVVPPAKGGADPGGSDRSSAGNSGASGSAGGGGGGGSGGGGGNASATGNGSSDLGALLPLSIRQVPISSNRSSTGATPPPAPQPHASMAASMPISAMSRLDPVTMLNGVNNIVPLPFMENHIATQAMVGEQQRRIQQLQKDLSSAQVEIQRLKAKNMELEREKSQKDGHADDGKKSSSRYWTPDEHHRFLEGLELYGQKDIKAISSHVRTRNATQVRTHAQKYYLRLQRERNRKGYPSEDGGGQTQSSGLLSGDDKEMMLEKFAADGGGVGADDVDVGGVADDGDVGGGGGEELEDDGGSEAGENVGVHAEVGTAAAAAATTTPPPPSAKQLRRPSPRGKTDGGGMTALSLSEAVYPAEVNVGDFAYDAPASAAELAPAQPQTAARSGTPKRQRTQSHGSVKSGRTAAAPPAAGGGGGGGSGGGTIGSLGAAADEASDAAKRPRLGDPLGALGDSLMAGSRLLRSALGNTSMDALPSLDPVPRVGSNLSLSALNCLSEGEKASFLSGGYFGDVDDRTGRSEAGDTLTVGGGAGGGRLPGVPRNSSIISLLKRTGSSSDMLSLFDPDNAERLRQGPSRSSGDGFFSAYSAGASLSIATGAVVGGLQESPSFDHLAGLQGCYDELADINPGVGLTMGEVAKWNNPDVRPKEEPP